MKRGAGETQRPFTRERRAWQSTASGEIGRWSGSPTKIVEARGLAQVTDRDELAAIVDAAITAHPDVAARYRAGHPQVLGYLVGQVMQRTAGRASPALVNDLLHERLDD